MALKKKVQAEEVQEEDTSVEPFPEDAPEEAAPVTKTRKAKSTANSEVNDSTTITPTEGGLRVEALFRRSASYKYADGTLDNYVAEGKVSGPMDQLDEITKLARVACAMALGVEFAIDAETGEVALGMPKPAQTPANVPSKYPPKAAGGGKPMGGGTTTGKKFGGKTGSASSSSSGGMTRNYDEATEAALWELVLAVLGDDDEDILDYFWDNTEGSKFPNLKPKFKAFEYLGIPTPSEIKGIFLKSAPPAVKALFED